MLCFKDFVSSIDIVVEYGSETWFHDFFHDSKPIMDGYLVYRCDRSNKTEEGCLLAKERIFNQNRTLNGSQATGLSYRTWASLSFVWPTLQPRHLRISVLCKYLIYIFQGGFPGIGNRPALSYLMRYFLLQLASLYNYDDNTDGCEGSALVD